MLANSNADSSQRLSILAAAAPNDATLSPGSSLNDFVKSFKYETAATVLRKCDEKMPVRESSGTTTSRTASKTNTDPSRDRRR